jgi:hypothetical protein
VVWSTTCTSENISEKLASMRTSYDPEADALYVRFAEAAIVDSEEVADGWCSTLMAKGALLQ